jgi:hypothetical protein
MTTASSNATILQQPGGTGINLSLRDPFILLLVKATVPQDGFTM